MFGETTSFYGIMMETRWALVTGASSGIGAAYAEELAKKGFGILLVSNQQAETEAKALLLHDLYAIETKILVMDLAKAESAKEVFDFCQAQHLTIDVLVNNAGMFFWSSLTKVADNTVATMLQLHVTTPTMLCYYFGKQMQERGRGYILNATSICAWMAFPTLSIYTSTKNYLKQFSYAIHYEMKQYGVNVCHVAPGAVDTDLYNLPMAKRKQLLKWHLMHTPQQIAQKGLKGLFGGQKRVVPGTFNYVAIALVKICPLCLVDSIRKRFFKQL